MYRRLIAIALLLFGAEVAASWWVWDRTPTDTVRVWYPGFWAFETGRLRCWVTVLALVLTLWIALWYPLLRRGRALAGWLFAAGLGVGLEVATSLLYWRSPQSSDIRGLYQSAWSWHRVPEPSDMGWPSFRLYLWDHIFPWTVILLIGLALWGFARERREI